MIYPYSKKESKTKKTAKPKKLKAQGGFSVALASSLVFTNYVQDKYYSGYLGSPHRTPQRDKIVEKLLLATGLQYEGVATWLTSGDGRHLMDDPCDNIKEFEGRARDYTKDAFIKVIIWAHPDHTGTLASTNKMKEAIKKALKG